MLEAEQQEPPKVTVCALTIHDSVPCANPKSRSIAGRATVTTGTSMPSGSVGTRQSFARPFASGTVDAMQVPPAIEAFVDRVSAGDGDAAAELVHDDAEFELPGNKSLPIGSAGARAFASRHGEVEGRLISVELKSAEAVRENCWVARLLFVNREIASGETMYEMEVGGLFELRHDRVARFRAFPSHEEAVAAAALGGPDG
jgi:ketosteroid isomerase-like protein